jgi:hypothetical protein
LKTKNMLPHKKAALVCAVPLLAISVLVYSMTTTEKQVNMPSAQEISFPPSIVAYTLGIDFYSKTPKEEHGTLGPRIIFAAWEDGTIVWSGNRIEGGAPYFTTRLSPEEIGLALSTICKMKDSIPTSNRTSYRGFDSPWTAIVVKSQNCDLYWESWHEIWESTGKHVCIDGFIRTLADEESIEDARANFGSIEYLAFVETWTDIKGAVLELIPKEPTGAEAATFTFRSDKATLNLGQ